MSEKITITYIITTNKNIRCYGCQQNCEKFQAEKYVDLETFRRHMQILKEVLPPSFELSFSEGEPLLHKQLIDLCKIAHETFPNININIHTNGILMNTIKNDQLLDLTKNNVNFYFYLYPIMQYLKTYQKQMSRFEELSIPINWSHEHIYFNKFTLNRYNQPCNDYIKTQKHLLIKDNKIYPLCSAIQTVQYNLLENSSNYIDINNLTHMDQINQLFHNIDCSYCNNSVPLSELYVNNYSKYESLTNYLYDIGSYLQIPLFFQNIKEATSTREFEAIINRSVNGQLDIFIPFSKETSELVDLNKLKSSLLSQSNIEKCNLYFVSIDEDLETQKKWFNTFESNQDSRLNTYFLKGKSLYLGEKKFFENSRIINHYILDITDLTALTDPLFFMHVIKNQRR